jgi:serine phosphatase RsbU (regulator of sigma subunit)
MTRSPFLLFIIVWLYIPKLSANTDTTKILELFYKARKVYSSEKNISISDSLNLLNAYRLSVQSNFIKGEFQYFDILGVYERNCANYATALDFHKKAYALIENTNLKKEKAVVLNNIGVVYRRIDNLNQAADYHLKALQIAEEIKDRRSVCISLNSLGNIYVVQGNYKKALEYFSLALSKENEIKNTLGVAINYNNIGSVYESQKNYIKAKEYYFRSLKKNIESKTFKGIGINYQNIGNICLLLKDYKYAEYYLFKALKIHQNQKDHIYTAYDLIKLGELYSHKKDFRNSFKYLKKGISLSEKIKSRASLQEAYEMLSNAFLKQKKADSALFYYKIAIAYKDSIFNESVLEDLNLKQVLYETGKKDKEIELLKYKQQVKDKKQKLITLILISGCLVFFSLMTLAYFTYRLKRKAHLTLLLYNRDIEEKNEELVQQKEEIMQQHEIIENKNILLQDAFETIKIRNNNITDNIRYAVQIQNALLPDENTISELFPDSFIYFVPRDIVSGDFYWMCKKNNKIVLAVADCTGHGVTGAFMSILGITALHEVVQDMGITAPHLILNELRSKIINILQQGNTYNESKDGIHMVVCTFEPEFRKMNFSGALNSIYLVRDQQISQYKGDKMPVSISPVMDSFTVTEIEIEKGDMLYLFTDGYLGQFGGNDDKKYNSSRFKNMLKYSSVLPLKEQKRMINNSLNAWKGNKDQVDDILVMGVRI